MPAQQVVTMAKSDFSVEQDRLFRLRGMIESHGADPSCILDTLHLVLISKDWRKVPDGHGGTMTFKSYIKTLGWSQDELLDFVTQSKHKREKKPYVDPQTVHEMEELRRAVRDAISPMGLAGGTQGNQNRASDKENDVRNTNTESPMRSRDTAPDVIARLARDASEVNEDAEDRRRKSELRERVVSGEISPHRAAIEAGWRQEMIQIPKDPIRAARRLLIHFKGDRLEALIRALSEGLKGH